MDSFLSEMGRDSRTELFTSRGEMGERIRAFAWSTTPLGPVDQWPENLLTLVATSLRSRFPIVIWWDRRHYTMLYNDAYIPFLGKTKHPGWLGQSGRDCWSEIWPTIGPMLESVFETGESTWSEDLLLVLDRNLPREEAYFTFSYSAIPGAHGEAEGIFCACTETTERVIGERRLRTLRDLASRSLQARSAEEACEFAARLFDQNATDIPFALVYLLDRDQRVAQLVACSGLSPSINPLAKDVVLSPPNGENAPWPLAEVERTGKPVFMSRLPDGAYALSGVGPWPEPPEQALVLPLKEPSQNQVTGFLVVGANPRRMLDESYKDFFQLVAGHVATAVANARAYEEERRRAEALAEVDRAKTLFFSNISHEFRTPLALMLGPIEDMLAEAPTLSSTQYQRAEMLHRNTLRILKLVNTLLDFSRIEAGRAEAVYEPTDLAILTADLASSFRSVMEKAGLRLTVKCPPLDAPIYVDRQMWENIVLNLLSNAFKYTLEGEITVTLEQRETTVDLSVEDTGVGIPAEELPHMFERFHRVRGTAGRTIEGTGIGLSLVQELVKLHVGTLSVSSVHGQGSTFTVSLPLGSAHLPQDRISTHRADIALGANVSFYVQEAFGLLTGQEDGIGLLADRPLNSKSRQPEREAEQPGATILFADDNADMREYVRRLLQQRYRVQTVSNGQEALAAAKKQRPDLILTDVMMPHMDGFALLKALRAEQATASIPVILLSARAGEEATLDGLQAGANDYLVKPFSAREVLVRVQAQLEITRLRREAELAREHLYNLLMQAPAGICVLRGKEHIFELANPPYSQLVGERELLGKAVREALPEMEEQGFFEQLDQVYRTGEPLVGNEVPTQLRRGPDESVEEAYFNFVYQPIRAVRGEVEGIMVHAVEVTEQVHARRRVDTFLGIASHELKNPLTSIKGNVELAQRRVSRALGEAAQQEDMQQLLDSVSLMLTRASRQIDFQNRLVSDLVDSTRIQVGKLELRIEPADLTMIVREAVEEQRQLASTRVIHLELLVDDGQCVNVDSNRIGQVVTNYLSNALKYSEEGQSVEVRVEALPTELRVAVQDQGSGLSEEEQAHIWERFYRAPGVQVKSGSGIGLGLGLHICQTIIEQHGGRVGVESKKGEGATFWFTLPRGPLLA